MIAKLTFSGLKGQRREHDLAPLTLVKGPNGSGKTATLQAIMTGFLGYEPRLGKRPEATMALAEDGRMSVQILTDKGFGVTRLFAFDPATQAVSQEIRLRGRAEMLQKEAEAEIAATLGALMPEGGRFYGDDGTEFDLVPRPPAFPLHAWGTALVSVQPPFRGAGGEALAGRVGTVEYVFTGDVEGMYFLIDMAEALGLGVAEMSRAFGT